LIPIDVNQTDSLPSIKFFSNTNALGELPHAEAPTLWGPTARPLKIVSLLQVGECLNNCIVLEPLDAFQFCSAVPAPTAENAMTLYLTGLLELTCAFSLPLGDRV
jgi:hypothetical protein